MRAATAQAARFTSGGGSGVVLRSGRSCGPDPASAGVPARARAHRQLTGDGVNTHICIPISSARSPKYGSARCWQTPSGAASRGSSPGTLGPHASSSGPGGA